MAFRSETLVEESRGAALPKRGGVKRIFDRNIHAYLFLLPWLIGFFGLTLGPALASLYLSFTNYDLLQSPDWVGRQITCASPRPTPNSPPPCR